MSARRANVRSIAAGSSFLPTLVAACRDGAFGFSFSDDPRDFSNATIYVPTRRAARALAHAFADALKPQSILLPRIIPLGDPADLEERAILAADQIGSGSDVPPAIGDLDRRLMLTSLVEQWRQSEAMRALETSGDGFTIGGGFADSFSLAGDLAGLIDEFTVESIDWNRLKDLPHGDYDTYWSLTRRFLDIAATAWPQHLEEKNLLDPAERLNRLLRNEASRLKAQPPVHPVIAAGSTGTVPATAALLGVIASLPKGAVILPGLDLEMDEKGWALVADQPASKGQEGAQPGHPQAALKRLLYHLGIERRDVKALGQPQPKQAIRQAIVQASARAAEATDDWPNLRDALEGKMASGLSGLCIVDAADEREEATAIAIALREVLETKEKTAALITPDRALAQRVAIELNRWCIVADDSSGLALGQMPLGSFARLTLQCLRQDFSPVATMALLSHACMDLPQGEISRESQLSAVELAGFRALAFAGGLTELSSLLDKAEERIADRRASLPLKRVSSEALASTREMLAAFTEAMRGMDAMRHGRHPIQTFAAAHDHLLALLAGERSSTGADAIALGQVMDRLQTGQSNTDITLDDYAGLFETLMAETVVPPSQPVQGRIKIWGLLEARLMQADRVVLGGLNEKTWPPDVRSDPFLNRSMRAALGLSSPERRIGQTAHDFAQGLGAEEVIMTRAMSVEGTPMIASRFVRRLDAFIGDAAAKTLRSAGADYLHSARTLDAAEQVAALKRPEPSPPAALQPPSLSITEISTLYRDPYAIYARHVLGLQPLNPLEQAVDARDKGTIIHEALATFIKETAEVWPADPLTRLLDIGRASFAPLGHLETVGAFWWPVFERVAHWFIDWENGRRGLLRESHVEVSGEISLPLADGTAFRLHGRADRIDALQGGGLAILDYKTSSSPPTKDAVGWNNEPQLTLMAAMARQGGFKGIAPETVSEISYISVGSEPAAKPIDLTKAHGTIESVASRHIEQLQSFLNRLRSGEEKFVPRRKPFKQNDSGDYDHLARNKEWMSASDETE